MGILYWTNEVVDSAADACTGGAVDEDIAVNRQRCPAGSETCIDETSHNDKTTMLSTTTKPKPMVIMKMLVDFSESEFLS